MIRYVNVKTVVVLVLAIIAIFAGAPGSLAYSQYLTDLNAVYGNGSCGICHIRTSGGGPLNSYGTLFQGQPGHVANASAALEAIGAPATTTTRLADVSSTAKETPAKTQGATYMATAATQTAPGFGFMVSLIGLFLWAFLARRHN